MKNRVLGQWTITRLLYLIMGGIVIAQTILEKQYFGLIIGGYFMAMGLFNFGCAAGSCYGGSCQTQEDKTKF